MGVSVSNDTRLPTFNIPCIRIDSTVLTDNFKKYEKKYDI